jgi:hypothetical protein
MNQKGAVEKFSKYVLSTRRIWCQTSGALPKLIGFILL